MKATTLLFYKNSSPFIWLLSAARNHIKGTRYIFIEINFTKGKSSNKTLKKKKNCLFRQLYCMLYSIFKAFNWTIGQRLNREQDDLDDAQEITAVWCGNGKKMIFVEAILDFWWPSWIDNGECLTLYSFHGNDHLYQFW